MLAHQLTASTPCLHTSTQRMEDKTPHIRGSGDSKAHPCHYRNLNLSRDPHHVWGCKTPSWPLMSPDHVLTAVRSWFRVSDGWHAQLTCLVSTPASPPMPPLNGVMSGGGAAVAVLKATTNWGSQLVIDPPQEEDVLDLDYGEDDPRSPEDYIFATLAQAAQPTASVNSRHMLVQTHSCPAGHPLALCCSWDHQILLWGEKIAPGQEHNEETSPQSLWMKWRNHGETAPTAGGVSFLESHPLIAKQWRT